MHKLKTFWQTYTKSLTEPSYYNDIKEAPFRFTARYLALFLVLLALANSIRFALQSVPYYKAIGQDVIHEVTTNYPADLVIHIRQGRVSLSGVEEPFRVPPPTHFKQQISNLGYDSLITFDTQAESPDDSSMLFVTNDTIFYTDPSGSNRAESVESVFDQDVTIERNGLQLLASNAQSTIDEVLSFVPILIFLFGIILYPLIVLIVNLIYTLLLFVLAKLRGVNITFLKSYQLSLHILTFAETARFLKNVFFAHKDVPSIYGLAFLGAILIIVNSLRSSR